jgi:hypothetical protein
MDSAEARKHFTPDEVLNLSDTWYAATRSAQWSSDFIQAMILMTVLMVSEVVLN